VRVPSVVKMTGVCLEQRSTARARSGRDRSALGRDKSAPTTGCAWSKLNRAHGTPTIIIHHTLYYTPPSLYIRTSICSAKPARRSTVCGMMVLVDFKSPLKFHE